MHTRKILPVLVALTLAPAAFADKFYFGSPDAAARMAAGDADVVEGVLLREENGNYVIRVEGGELTVPKAMVYKVEKDGLTIANLEKLEGEIRASLTAANEARVAAQRADAAARMAELREVRAAEASLRASEDAAAPASEAGAIYDPILHRATELGLGGYVQDLARQELGGVLRARLRREMQRMQRELRDSR